MITELSATMISSYKRCYRRFYLEYIEDLKPVASSEALTVGSSYHENLENILKGQEFNHDGLAGKMAEAFQKYVDYKSWQAAPEQDFKIRLSRGVYLKGRLDAVTQDGFPVEHKTTGSMGIEKYIDHLAYDDQISLYMLVTGKERAIYTVIQKPTIRLKKDETEEEYLERVSQWYDEEPERKILTLNVVRTKNELEEKRQEIIALAKEMKHRKLFYRNPNTCMITSCPYASICLNYEPDIQLAGFYKKERTSEELCKF